VVADEAELGRLGFQAVGDFVEVMGRRVRLVGTVRGLKSLAAPYLFCSLPTARMFFQGVQADQTIFVLARCRHPDQSEAVVRRLREEDCLAAYTSADFSTRTRLHWVTATKAGLATFWSAVLGLILGLVITSQTLYQATAAARREFAVLDALGIPTRRMAATVLAQSFWLGVAGLAIGLPAAFGVAYVLNQAGVKVILPAWLVAPGAALVLAAVVLSGLFALRSLRLIEPAQLLR
jgi:putative ABC transport system permease protein